jgi:uncharacterized membrane protein
MLPQAPAPTLWRLAGTGAALGSYAVMSHWLMVHAPDRPWSVAALFGPLWATLAVGAWLRRHWPTLLACAAVLALVVAVMWHGGVGDIHLMYLLQHGCLHAAFAGAFGSTLRAGRVPLITALAERVHTTVTPAMRRYTRRLTQVWTIYFVAMLGISAALYLLAPWSWWSLFCNLVSPLAVAAVFAAEHVWRRWRHPEFERVSLLRVWQVYRRS